MRFMVLVKASKDSEAGVMPSTELLTAMGKYNEELVKAGIMKGGDGLQPSSKGARVRFAGKERSVIDGPFTETKELVAGYWLWECKSLAEAIDWLKRCPNPHYEDCAVEIRQIFSPEDFGAAFTPELQAQEQQLTVDIEAQNRFKSTSIFVNLPVKDLQRSIAFFRKLGYTFNAQFTDDNATCMLVGEKIYVMLLVESMFKTFTPKALVDATKNTEALVALSLESREAVNKLVDTALAAGARRYAEPKDHGFMYQWGFEDLDGHIWEYFWMDPAHVQK